MAVTDEAIEKIKAMILSGELPAGFKLPNEEVFANQLGLSRNSLREAVRALAAMKILVSRHGDGTYVSSLEPHLLIEAATFAADMSQGQAALQLLQVRRLLEPQAVALAANLITDVQLAHLLAELDASEAADTIDEFLAHDIEFHRLIIDIVGNPVLSMLLQVVSTRTQRFRFLRGIDADTALQSVHREHKTIYEALAVRDSQMAAAATMVHIAAVERWLANSTHSSAPNMRSPGTPP
jgi:GntR family transcriptional regulator, transcriptional repressor for pyruvate dehydrogenase complex